MGTQEFAQPVRGSGAQPVSTAVNGAIETNNYRNAEYVEYPASYSYGDTVDPAFDVQEILAFRVADGKEVDMTLVDGETVEDVDPAGSEFTLNFLEVDSFTVKDAADSGGNTHLLVIGE